MNAKEIPIIMSRIAKFKQLESREEELIMACCALENISGNESEVRPIESMEFYGHLSTAPVRLGRLEITTWDVRQAILPLVQEKLRIVRQEKEAL